MRQRQPFPERGERAWVAVCVFLGLVVAVAAVWTLVQVMLYLTSR